MLNICEVFPIRKNLIRNIVHTPFKQASSHFKRMACGVIKELNKGLKNTLTVLRQVNRWHVNRIDKVDSLYINLQSIY